MNLVQTEELDSDLSGYPVATGVVEMEADGSASLRPFFRPRSVAVVGASRQRGSIGYRVVEALLENEFQGPIYPVNPRADEVLNLYAYPSVRDLPEGVDLAIIAVPREAVLGVVDECAARGVRALVVISAGFAEVGPEGQELQDRLLDRVRRHGMRMIGPNCMGLLNTDPGVRLNATFVSAFPPAGRVAMSSQSGALGLAVLAAARRLHLGLSSFVSVGNKADVSGNDLLQFWEEDPNTGVILLYLESFGNPRRFARIARRVARSKPVVALKSGRTRAGQRAASSHTAALAADESTVHALFRQTGVIRADTLQEMFDLAQALGNQPLPRGTRVGILTNAGGPGILCADACEAAGLALPEFSAGVKARLMSFLPAAACAANPVDMIASATPAQYREVIDTLMSSGQVDALIAVHLPLDAATATAYAEAILQGVAAARRKGAGGIPVLACLMSPSGSPPPLEAGDELIPAYPFPEEPARVLGKMADYARWQSRPAGVIPAFVDVDLTAARAVCEKALARRGACWLSAEEVRTLLTAVRLPLPAGGLARTAEEAARLAEGVGFPVAVKLASSTLLHKTELGGVHLNLADTGAVRRAFAAIHDRLEKGNQLAAMEGVLVQPMIPGGTEVMVGATHDPLFGPVVAFGLGGIHVEILRDVCFRVTPLTDRDALEMIREIRGARLLEGYRGHPPADTAALGEVLLRISCLVEEIPEIAEVDLNPVFALAPGEGCVIVDARVRLEEKSPP
jgi:acetyl coenzyme A synthetase (ADP forming)-like protein